jgi:hypothetical protein
MVHRSRQAPDVSPSDNACYCRCVGAVDRAGGHDGADLATAARSYYRRLCYDPRQHCMFGVDGATTETISIGSDGDEFVMPAAAAHYARGRKLDGATCPWHRLFYGCAGAWPVWLAEL